MKVALCFPGCHSRGGVERVVQASASYLASRGHDVHVFANEWDPKYQSVLESHDPGEQPMPGGMLYAKYGKGVYIFSAYAWFRELPGGVPGAYRLFANMLSAK